MGDDWFRVGPIKIVADGGILIGTAYLREPYGTHTASMGMTIRITAVCWRSRART